jgi:hypothetical protein
VCFIQFPFHAVIFGMIVGTGISDWLAKLFAAITTHSTFPLLVAIYSAVLGGVYSIRRKQVGDRGPLCTAGRKSSSRASGMGGANLQRC